VCYKSYCWSTFNCRHGMLQINIKSCHLKKKNPLHALSIWLSLHGKLICCLQIVMTILTIKTLETWNTRLALLSLGPLLIFASCIHIFILFI
jgi:hypothetical protein